jgi:endonuclease YncB( thermonuclease family)
MYTYKSKVTKVYDGDTITVEVDLGFSFKFTNSFRLLRINCPEVRGESREEGLKKQRQTERTYNGQRGNYKTQKTILKSMVDTLLKYLLL